MHQTQLPEEDESLKLTLELFGEAVVADLLEQWEQEREDESPELKSLRATFSECILTEVWLRMLSLLPEHRSLDGRMEREDELIAQIRPTMTSMKQSEFWALWDNFDAREQMAEGAVAELRSWIEQQMSAAKDEARP